MTDSYLFRVIAIPAAVFLSVIFGASYGSGREVVEFVSSNGPRAGLVALCTVALTHAVLLVISFEIARLYRSYDYQSFCKVLLGPGWIVYEIVILCGMLIALSITTTVGGTVLGDHFSIANWFGGLLIFLFVVVFSYWGREAIEKSMMLSIVALFCVLAVLVVQLFSGHANTVANAFATEPYQAGAVMNGLKYAIGGGGYIPILLYCAIGLRTRAEAVTAGIVAAFFAIIPATIFHFAFMAGYPEVIDQSLPAYWMFGFVSTPLLLNVYVVVMFVLVAQTGIGLLQGLIERIDHWKVVHSGKELAASGHAGIAALAIIVSMALGSMGIVALILRGYTIMFMSFIVVFVMPLISYGLYLVVRGHRT